MGLGFGLGLSWQGVAGPSYPEGTAYTRAGRGLVSFAGFAPSVSAGFAITAGLGAVALDGFAPDVSTADSVNVTAGLGEITVAGFAPTVTAGGSVSVTAGLGAVTVAGFAPTVTVLPGISGNAGGTVDITIDDGTFSVTVSGSDYAHQNGTFGPFATADLDSGPVLVVAPVISGSAVEGSTLTAAPGLWVHDAADGTTTVTAIWQADGVDISGETGTTYVTVGGDVGAEITYEEEATNDAGARTSDSNGITVIVAPSDGDAALLETGDTILLENGDRLLLDVIPSIALLENGDNILLETGDNMLLEA